VGLQAGQLAAAVALSANAFDSQRFQGLGAKYDNAQAHVDPSVKDANRLTKIIGTTARKGDAKPLRE